MKLFAILLLSLGAVEGFAFWWMHPEPTGLRQPVLVYRPSRSGGVPPASQKSETEEQRAEIGLDDSSLSISPSQSFKVPAFHSTHTPLPEIYHKAAPMLRCSSGQVFHAQLDDTLGLHFAFFEWDDTDTGSVLEAFRHMPEACMGSIGMSLVSKENPIRYQVCKDALVFDHTIFLEAGQGGGLAALALPVHAFRAVWVAGMADSNARQGMGGDEFEHLRTIRLKSALTRFRPTHARVIQGAVRGASSGHAAWQAFESAMLKDLAFQ